MAGNLGKTRPGAGYTGTRRQRHRRSSPPRVPIPYAPTPKGRRAAAAAGELDRIGETPAAAARQAAEARRIARITGPQASATAAGPRISPYAYEPPDALAIEVETKVAKPLEDAGYHETTGQKVYKQIATYAPYLLPELPGLLKGVGGALAKSGARDIATSAVEGAAQQGVKASAKLAEEAGATTRASRAPWSRAGGRGPVRTVVTKAAQKAEPAVVRAAREGAARRAAAQATKLPAPVRVGAKVAAQAASYPVKHPFTAPLTLQAPAFALSGGDPKEFLKGLEGKGLLAGISAKLGTGAAAALPGKVGQVANEAVNLPAVVLPSTYLLGKAAVEKAGGDSKELDKLWDEWVETGLIPAVVTGDLPGALDALEERPLYSGLEGSGLLSVAGRSAGAIARKATNGRVAGRARPDMTVEGYPTVKIEREFSPDLIRQIAQRAADRRSGNVIRPGTGNRLTPTLERRGDYQFRKHVVRDAGDRFHAQRQDAQRTGRTAMHEVANEILPRKRGAGRLRKVAPRSTLDRASADVVVHAIERTIQHPETFATDLKARLADLNKIAADRYDNGLSVLNKEELKANRAQAASIEKALKRANPEHVVEAANEFIAAHQPIVQELVDRGVLNPEQASKAAAIPFARVHMGSSHGLSRADDAELARLRTAMKRGDLSNEQRGKLLGEISKVESRTQVLDSNGDSLSLDQIAAEMQRRGIEPPGFISHRAATKGDYWAPANERASIPKGKRTGQAALRGTYDASHEAVVRQLIRSRGLLDRIKTWDEFITRFGRTIKEFNVKSMADAKRVIDDPARYGLNPNIKWRPVRRQPFTAMKSEIDAALEHQDPTIASEGVLAEALKVATNEHGPEGAIVFMPEQVVANMEAQFQPLSPALKGVQLTTTGLKRAVLPFSPSYYFGNAIDNTIRTALAGVGPQHFIAGFKVGQKLDRETKDQMLGAAYSSVEKLSARRTHEDFAGTAAQGFAEAAAAFRAAPGPKQLIDLVSATSHALLSVNSKLTERLPQYGALGKIAMQDIRNTQGEWAAVLRLQDKFVEDIVKGIKDNPDTRIRYEKGLERIYGNWSRMSPHARKFLSNFFPFWTWSRAALKLVYGTLPAHHSIETGILAAAARMTQEDREKLGLDLLGEEPQPNFLQGGLPIRGSISPWGKYTSFGYAGHPLESIASGVLPQVRDTLAAGEGRDWKGDKLGGSELSHLGEAAVGSLGTYIPGYNTVQGLLDKGPGFLSPVHVEDPEALPYLRSLSESKTITVPDSGSSGGSGAPWRSSGGLSGGAAPWRR